MRALLSLLLLSAAFVPLAAHAADDSANPPHIIIHALKSDRPLNQVASSVTVIDSEQISRENKSTVIELLREVPGVAIAQSGGPGQNARIFLRGTNSNHVLVVMDGVAINDPSDPATAFDISNLTTDNIERIEILRGPQSTLYGSQALGGVISITTKKGEGAPKYFGSVEYGRYNTAKTNVTANGVTGKTSYSLSVGGTHTDGISAFDKSFGGKEKDGSDGYTFSGNVQSKLTDNFTAKVVGRYNRLVTDNDSTGSIGGGGARPDDDLFPDTDARQINLRGAGELSLMDGNWVQELGLSTLNVNRGYITEWFDSTFTPHFSRQVFKGRRDTVDWVHHLKFIPNSVTTVGLEAYTDYAESSQFSRQNVDNKAIFIDEQYNVTPDLFLNGSARLDNHQSFGKQFTWKIAPGYNIAATNTRLKVTYGTGFKAPSLSQLFDPTAGNPALNPERSRGWDAGFEQTLLGGKVVFGSTYFFNNITNLIGFGGPPLFPTINVGKARTQGVESNIMLKPLKDWTVNFGHTYTIAQNQRTHADLLRRPKNQFNLGSTYQYNEKGDVGMNLRYNGARRDFLYSDSSLTNISGYGVVDLVTNYKIRPNASVYARLDNVLDKRYQEVSGFGQPGRGLYVGVKGNF